MNETPTSSHPLQPYFAARTRLAPVLAAAQLLALLQGEVRCWLRRVDLQRRLNLRQ